mgnify:FL=1
MTLSTQQKLQTDVLKTFSAVFFIFDIFVLYLHTRCKKCNVKFDKLIKTIGHRACLFKK